MGVLRPVTRRGVRVPAAPLMSSLRDSPFSFSPDLRDSLGSPDALNVAVRSRFPSLFGDLYRSPTVVQLTKDGAPRVVVRPGASIPAGALLGLFRGHIFFSDLPRGDFLLPLPPFITCGSEMRLVVDGAARASRSSNSSDAALFCHSCGPSHSWGSAAAVGSWWSEGGVPCLVAHAARPLSENECIAWDFDSPSSDRPFTLPWPEARDWRRAGHLIRRCPCNAPRDCPRDRFLRVPDAA